MMKTLLIVDDEAAIRESLKWIFKDAYEVVLASEGRQALQVIDKKTPDLILLDIMMPGTDGYQICNQIKEDTSMGEIPVIFLTGKDSKDDQGKSFQSGGDMFIKKPFS